MYTWETPLQLVPPSKPGNTYEYPWGGGVDFGDKVSLLSTGCPQTGVSPCLGLQVYECIQHDVTQAALTTTVTPVLQRRPTRWTGIRGPWSVVKFQYEGA